MIRLVGYQQKKGNFTQKETGELVEYDNTELYYTTDEKSEVKGVYADSAKAKTEQLKIIGAKTLDDAIGKEVYLIVDVTTRTDKDDKARLNIGKIVVVG